MEGTLSQGSEGALKLSPCEVMPSTRFQRPHPTFIDDAAVEPEGRLWTLEWEGCDA
jgi:hypothetical protein